MSDPIKTEKQDGVDELPVSPGKWSVAQLGKHGLILTCDEFQIRLSRANVEKFFDLIVDEEAGNVQTDDGFWIEVDADSEDGDVIVRPLFKSDKKVNPYPHGVIIDADTLKDFGVTIDEVEEEVVEEEPTEPAEEEPVEEDENSEEEEVTEGVKMAYRKSGKKLKRGFRVTSGIRKGRVVADIKTAHKPKAKASTRMKLKLARKKKKVIRILKSKRTRKKSLSKRLKRLNSK